MASFNSQSLMFSMEELVGVVKLIIQMESAIANEDPQPRRHKKRHKKEPRDAREPPNIQRWISKRSKRDILFLLASISGVKMKIFSLPLTATSTPSVKSKNSTTNKISKSSICRERVCRVSMDGKYLSMGEDCIHLDKHLEVSLGLDLCYKDVCVMLKHLGLYHYYTSRPHDSSSSGFSTGSTQSTHSSSYNSYNSYHSSYSTGSSSTITEEISSQRLHHNFGGGKLKPKHCITIHDPNMQRTLILELPNCRDRTMWAKGLCGLKHLNQKARNFRWTVVAYLISKYASTLNAHSKQNLDKNKGLKGVSKGLNALKMGLKGSKPKAKANPMNTPCYFEPFAQLIRVIGAQGNNGLNPKYPRRFHEMNQRREQRLRNHKSNNSQFGENDLMYDPNKVQAKPEDADVYYE